MRLLAELIAVAFAVPFVAGQDDTPTKRDLLKFEKQLKAAHSNAGPSIACVVVSRSDKYPGPLPTAGTGRLGGFDREAFLQAEPTKQKLADQLDLSKPETIPDHGFAGGIVVDAAGVLTNYHTIEGATKIFVHLPGGKGSYADIRAADERSDLAVLSLQKPPADLKAVRFGITRVPDSPNDSSATIAPGSLALLMAYPYASGAVMDRPSAGLASIASIRHPQSKRERNNKNNADVLRSIYRYAPLLELDSRLNAGISGAAVLNLEGEVVAVTTAVGGLPANEGGPTIALPIDENLVRIIGVLRRGEEVEYGFLGVSQPDFPPRVRGIALERIPMSGSPAHAAGLVPGDVITRINDHPVSTFEDLLLYIGSGLAGGEIKVRYDRNGRSHDVAITLAKFKNDMAYIATVKPEPVFGLRVDYTSVTYQSLINPFGGRHLAEIPSGVHVRELIPGSPAAMKFKALGENNRWVITQVNGKSVFSPAEFYKQAKGQRSVKLTVTDPTDASGRRDATVTLP